MKHCVCIAKGTTVPMLFWTVLLVATVLSCVGNTAISSGIDRLPRGQIVAVLLRWYRVYRRQTTRHTVLFGLISTAEINGKERCMCGQQQHPVRAGRIYARQGAKTLPGREGNDHKFNGKY